MDRIPFKGSRLDVERLMLEEFKSRAHQYLPANAIPSSDFEWLALMQHHLGQTRLLDWTFSPYVAAFFALDEVRPTEVEYCAVWAIALDIFERCRSE